MSQPPDYPGRQRLKRAAASAGSEAYQGAFEAVGSILISCAAGYWVDSRWDTAPVGLLVGTIVGFAAMVLRLMRLGKELHPEPVGKDSARTSEPLVGDSDELDELDDPRDVGPGEAPGMSSVLRRDDGEEE